MSELAYIGVRPCGCVTFAMVQGLSSPEEMAEEIAVVIKSGRRIESVPVEEARRRLTFDCKHEEAAA